METEPGFITKVTATLSQFFSHYYQGITFLLLLVIFLMFIWALIRLRHLNKRSYIVERRVHDTSESIVDLLAIQSKRNSIKLDDALNRITTTLNQIQGDASASLTSIQAMQQKLSTRDEQLQDALYDISNNMSSSGSIQQDVHNIYGRVEKLNEELMKANRWFENMQALEKVVIKLVGREKMEQLIEKEKSIRKQEVRAIKNKDLL